MLSAYRLVGGQEAIRKCNTPERKSPWSRSPPSMISVSRVRGQDTHGCETSIQVIGLAVPSPSVNVGSVAAMARDDGTPSGSWPGAAAAIANPTMNEHTKVTASTMRGSLASLLPPMGWPWHRWTWESRSPQSIIDDGFRCLHTPLASVSASTGNLCIEKTVWGDTRS